MFKLYIIWDLLKSFFKPRFGNREELRRYQTHQLNRHLKWVSRHSPFYRGYENKPLNEWPVMNKQKMMEHFDQLNTGGVLKSEAFRIATAAETTRDFKETLPQGITVGLSSGTSGNKGIFLATPRERAQWVAQVLQKVLPIQLLKKQKIAFFLRSNSTLYESIRSSVFEFHYFDLKQHIHQLFNQLVGIKADILIAPPSVLLALSECYAQQQQHHHYRKVISVAEVLEPDVRVKLQKAFGQTIHQVYQATEGFLGSTCSEGVLHLHEDLIHFELKFLEGSTTAFYPVISDFCRKTQPMIRYELNDILHVRNEPCGCGSLFTAIDHIEGRSDDVLKFEGALFFPDFFRHAVILSSDSIANYRIVQNGSHQLRIELQLEAGASFSEIQTLVTQKVNALFEQKGVSGIHLEFDHLLISGFHDKFRRVVKAYQDETIGR